MTITIYDLEITKGKYKGKKGYSFDYPSSMLVYNVTVHSEEDNVDYWVNPAHVKIVGEREIEVPEEFAEVFNHGL